MTEDHGFDNHPDPWVCAECGDQIDETDLSYNPANGEERPIFTNEAGEYLCDSCYTRILKSRLANEKRADEKSS